MSGSKNRPASSLLESWIFHERELGFGMHLGRINVTRRPRLRNSPANQRIYILGCLGDLERQSKNHAAASEHFDRAIELAWATFILAEKKDE